MPIPPILLSGGGTSLPLEGSGWGTSRSARVPINLRLIVVCWPRSCSIAAATPNSWPLWPLSPTVPSKWDAEVVESHALSLRGLVPPVR